MCPDDELRDAGDSRACSPDGAPYVWFDARDKSSESMQFFTEWLASQPGHVQRSVVTQIDALEGLASRGAIVLAYDESDPLKAICHDPDMYELRWTFLTLAVRQYHAEPERFPKHLIKLHMHVKYDSLGKLRPLYEQQDEIEYAKGRYRVS